MDTIAAIATGTAATAIGVLRISGENCFAVCDRVFQPLDGTPLSAHEPRKMIYGDVVDADGRAFGSGSCGAVPCAPQLHRRGLRGIRLPRLPHRAAGGAERAVCRRGAAGAGRRIHQARLSQRTYGFDPGRGRGGSH
jgi:hypothetical protein